MFTVYVLRSTRTKKRYVGYTGKDVRLRLKEHNLGISKFTKGHIPLEIIYTEEYSTKSEARKRELFLKTGKGREFLDNTFGPLA